MDRHQAELLVSRREQAIAKAKMIGITPVRIDIFGHVSYVALLHDKWFVVNRELPTMGSWETIIGWSYQEVYWRAWKTEDMIPYLEWAISSL